jgi:MerR family redox-sensitive transcriptional activator SoxR
MLRSREILTIGTVADRTGLAVSAIRFYEEQGLIKAHRSEAGHRRFERSEIRRISFIRICQQLGYSLEEIRSQLEVLPEGRTPTEKDWQGLAAGFASDIESRIAGLQQLKDKLDGCIGCGCLSLQRCELYNIDDGASRLGSGPRYLLGDSADDVSK